MHKLSEHFEQLLSDILPPEGRLEQARNLTGDVRDFLEASDKIDTVEPHTRLMGSYACSTAIASVRDMKDVDFLVFVDPAYELDKPSIALRELKVALGEYPSVERIETTTQRRSIHLHLQGHDFHLDIVPAVAPKGPDKPLRVPDRFQQEWIDSDPLGYVSSLGQLNQENLGKVSMLIRLFKHWRDVHMQIMRPKSYWLSCLVYNLTDDGSLTYPGVSFAELFRELMTEIQRRFHPAFERPGKVPSIKDPMLGTELTVGHWDRSDFETFMRRVDETVAWANLALGDDIEKEKVISLWQNIFGREWFPELIEQHMKPKLVDSTGRIGLMPIDRGKSIEIPRHRFYGEE